MKISVIMGSSRPMRRGFRVAKWIMPALEKIGGAQYDLIDLAEYPLPFVDEETTAEQDAIIAKFKTKLDEADGYIVITPEYNHGTSGVLKNAMDYHYDSWARKAMGFVSYSVGPAAGIRAVEQIRANAIELHLAPMQNAVHIPLLTEAIDEDGKLLHDAHRDRLEKVVAQLLWWTQALKVAREKD